MWWQNGTSAAATQPRTSTQDVEALERVIEALDTDVSDEIDAHERIMRSLVDSLGLVYGAAWLPGDDGFVLRLTEGALAPTMAAAWSPGEVMTEGAGYGGEALRSRRTVLMDTSSGTATCPRWATAAAAGARQGCFLPVVEGTKVTAVLECYTRSELPFFGGHADRWQTIGRLVAHARRSALATAQLRENLDDRNAVTTVVSKVGEATDEATALRIALLEEQVEMAKAFDAGR
jgi:hypothetical protein